MLRHLDLMPPMFRQILADNASLSKSIQAVKECGDEMADLLQAVNILTESHLFSTDAYEMAEQYTSLIKKNARRLGAIENMLKQYGYAAPNPTLFYGQNGHDGEFHF
jgi:hypothetical protein